MADRHASLLQQALDTFRERPGWSPTDLARFRMQADDNTGDGDAGGAGGGDDDTGDGGDQAKQLSAEDIDKMQRALKKANKEAEQHRLKLKEYEDRDKSETEKLTERARELESTLTNAEKAALRYEVALDKSLPKSLAVRLQGDTREEMEADAEELLKTLGGNNSNGKKRPSFDGGAKDDGHSGSGSFLTQALRDAKQR